MSGRAEDQRLAQQQMDQWINDYFAGPDDGGDPREWPCWDCGDLVAVAAWQSPMRFAEHGCTYLLRCGAPLASKPGSLCTTEPAWPDGRCGQHTEVPKGNRDSFYRAQALGREARRRRPLDRHQVPVSAGEVDAMTAAERVSMVLALDALAERQGPARMAAVAATKDQVRDSRHRRAVTMRRAGVILEDIGEALGVSGSRAHTILRSG